MSYTPGLWEATERIDHATHAEAAVWGPDGDMIAQVYGNLGLDSSGIETARLIALAPEMLDVLKVALKQPDKAIEIMKREGFVIDNLEDRWQKLAFTFYTMIVENATDAKSVIDKAETKE